MKNVIVCIAKDEDFYIEEWVDYHKKLGFDEIYIYTNDWNCGLERDFITKMPISGKHKQMEAYQHFLNNFRTKFDWVSFLDCDEFIVLKKHKNIKEFLVEFDNPFAIGINWYFFGSDGKMSRDNENSLIKQFTKREKNVNQHIKTIMKLSSGGVMVYPHNPNVPILGTNKQWFNGPFNKEGNNDVAQINHYHYKTYEDWLIRISRGQADHTPIKKPEEWIQNKNNFCEVEDLHALNFMYN